MDILYRQVENYGFTAVPMAVYMCAVGGKNYNGPLGWMPMHQAVASLVVRKRGDRIFKSCAVVQAR